MALIVVDSLIRESVRRPVRTLTAVVLLLTAAAVGAPTPGERHDLRDRNGGSPSVDSSNADRQARIRLTIQRNFGVDDGTINAVHRALVLLHRNEPRFGVVDLATRADDDERLVRFDLTLSSAPFTTATRSTVGFVRDVLELHDCLEHPAVDLRGSAVDGAQAISAARERFARFGWFTFAAMAVTALAVVRMPVALCITALSAGLSAGVGSLVLPWIPPTVIPRTVPVSAWAGTALTSIGLTLHQLLRFHEEVGMGFAPDEAARRTAERTFRPVSAVGFTLACFTTIGAFVSRGSDRAFAVGLLIGSIAVVLTAVAVTPALFALFGRFTFAPRGVRSASERHQATIGSVRVAPWVARFALPLLMITVVLTVPAVLIGVRTRPTVDVIPAVVEQAATADPAFMLDSTLTAESARRRADGFRELPGVREVRVFNKEPGTGMRTEIYAHLPPDHSATIDLFETIEVWVRDVSTEESSSTEFSGPSVRIRDARTAADHRRWMVPLMVGAVLISVVPFLIGRRSSGLFTAVAGIAAGFASTGITAAILRSESIRDATGPGIGLLPIIWSTCLIGVLIPSAFAVARCREEERYRSAGASVRFGWSTTVQWVLWYGASVIPAIAVTGLLAGGPVGPMAIATLISGFASIVLVGGVVYPLEVCSAEERRRVIRPVRPTPRTAAPPGQMVIGTAVGPFSGWGINR